MKHASTLALCVAYALSLPALSHAADSNAASPDPIVAARAVGLNAPTLADAGPPADPPAAPGADAPPNVWHGERPAIAGMGAQGPQPGLQRPMGPPEVHAAIETIDEIESLYMDTGRVNELPAFYRSVLSKTHDPLLRHVLQHRLADAELKPANPDEAIATLRGSLDETLARLDSRPAARVPAH